MNTVLMQRYLALVILPVFIFIGCATLITNEVEIQLLNSIRLSLACGVLFAYLPAVIEILHAPEPLRQSDLLSFGIVYSWLGSAGSGLWWVGFQLAGRPEDWSNTDFVAATIFLSCMGALFHFAAPAAINGRVPPMRQIKIGGLVAIGMLGALVIFDASDIRMRFQGFMYLHDTSPGLRK